MFCRRQSRDLLAWARANDRLIQSTAYSSLAELGGEKHRVWLDESRQVYCKATYPGRFGLSVIADSTGLLAVPATALEYLEQLLLHNAVFGDRIQLEGIAIEQSGLVILTAQPNITGEPATRDEIFQFMHRLWFRLLLGISLGRPGALQFYRDLDEVAVFDAHPGNFVKDANGMILPIDLVLVRMRLDLILVRESRLLRETLERGLWKTSWLPTQPT